jgi:hypothetical protein
MIDCQLASQSWYQSPSWAKMIVGLSASVDWLNCCWLSPAASPGFSLLEIHDQGFCSLLHMYMFRNRASSSMRKGLVSLCRCYVYWAKVKVKVMLSLAEVDQSLLVLGTHMGFIDQTFIAFTQLQVCWRGAPCLMKGWVCRLQFLMGLTNAFILGSGSHRTLDHILLYQIWDSPQPGGPDPHIYIPQEQGGPVIPKALDFIFVATYESQGCFRPPPPPPNRLCLLITSKSKLHCDRQSVGQSVLVSGTHLEPVTQFLLSSESCGFLDMDGSVIYSCCWALPTQSFSGPSPMRLMTIFYSLKFETPPTLRVRFQLFICPRNRVAQSFPQALDFVGYTWFCLYSLSNDHRKHCFQQLCYCVCICCHRRVIWHQYSGISILHYCGHYPSCYITCSLRLLVLSGLQAYCHFLCSDESACEVCGTSGWCWGWQSLHFQWRPAQIMGRTLCCSSLTAAPNLGLLTSSGSVIRHKPVQVYCHHPYSRMSLNPLHHIDSGDYPVGVLLRWLKLEWLSFGVSLVINHTWLPSW